LDWRLRTPPSVVLIRARYLPPRSVMLPSPRRPRRLPRRATRPLCAEAKAALRPVEPGLRDGDVLGLAFDADPLEAFHLGGEGCRT
jgi:hypothetical protein